MIKIGILGDIGSGKSYVAKIFGYPVFNADKEVGQLYKKDKKIYNKLKKITEAPYGFYADLENYNIMSGSPELYIKKRGNSNLMEHMDKHRKRGMLMEGAMKRLFVMFDQGMTDEEIVQDHATKGVQVPEAFISTPFPCFKPSFHIPV